MPCMSRAYQTKQAFVQRMQASWAEPSKIQKEPRGLTFTFTYSRRCSVTFFAASQRASDVYSTFLHAFGVCSPLTDCAFRSALFSVSVCEDSTDCRLSDAAAIVRYILPTCGATQMPPIVRHPIGSVYRNICRIYVRKLHGCR
jgi:hypothetical protein